MSNEIKDLTNDEVLEFVRNKFLENDNLFLENELNAMTDKRIQNLMSWLVEQSAELQTKILAQSPFLYAIFLERKVVSSALIKQEKKYVDHRKILAILIFWYKKIKFDKVINFSVTTYPEIHFHKNLKNKERLIEDHIALLCSIICNYTKAGWEDYKDMFFKSFSKKDLKTYGYKVISKKTNFMNTTYFATLAKKYIAQTHNKDNMTLEEIRGLAKNGTL